MEDIHPLFYVELRDDFDDNCAVREKSPSFPGMIDPFLEAQTHVTRGKVYPVLQIKGDHDLLILDDKGFLYTTPQQLYKFSDKDI
ncbi:hypothetical protein EXM22_06975 [Oceanispirochaeta crateris]|jgi:hypothetical protein|uniref:Uncharacterized protein n=1 Tax=Oceanispirochaeta crateris TaxID=2518645 RepID=A0A5C1QMG7_9SPIO|nr:hypothetical protein [Oceanispirochaeta crateris]QEN07744.1 hypothetical protein EXM22_06975 [Oceanispirochaeta crateris]